MLKNLTTILAIACTCAATAQSNLNKAKLDSLFDGLEQQNRAMGQVAVSKDGKLLYNRAFGYRLITDAEKTKSDVNTKYRIGSITKTFTATMVLQLVEEGKLTLDTKLSQFFPKLPNASEITIRQMLQHKSGLHNFTDDSTYLDFCSKPHTRDMLLAKFETLKPDFAPGASQSYSNTAYVLLGFMVEDLTKKSYADALQQRIVQKLKLKSTYAGGKIQPEKNEAYSYTWSGTRWEPAGETDMTVPRAAGCIEGTTADLNAFAEGLFAGKLLKATTLDTMKKIDGRFGLGLIRFPFGKKWAYGHTGGIDGFNSMLTYLPDDKVTVSYTGNGLNYELNDVMIYLLNEATGVPWSLPSTKTVAVSTETLRKYAGNYASAGFPLKIKVWENEGKLMAQATGQGAFPLEAVDETTFKFSGAGIEMKFKTNEAGKPSFVLNQAGRSYTFEQE